MNFFRFKTFHPKGSKFYAVESIVLIGLIFTMGNAMVKRAVTASSEIRADTLRLHIIANSDSDFDQNLKLKVRDKVLEVTGGLFAEASGKSEAKALAEYSSDDIKAAAEEVIAEAGANYEVRVEIVKMWFETRSYEGFTLPAGDYDAVRIIIGEGEGKNWWCVMYPQLCIPGAKDSLQKYGENASFVQGDGYEIRFALIEWFEKLKHTITSK